MVTEADFEALSAHLQSLRPIFNGFCIRHGFAEMPRQSTGRYPRIRIARDGATALYFDLWMDLDAQGRRFETFRDDLPYSLYAGASVVEDDGSMHGVRYHQGVVCFMGKPFDQVGAVLEDEMEACLPLIESWSRELLIREGDRKELGR